MHSLAQVGKLVQQIKFWQGCGTNGTHAVCGFLQQYNLESNLAISNKVEEISYSPAIPFLGTKILIKASFV